MLLSSLPKPAQVGEGAVEAVGGDSLKAADVIKPFQLLKLKDGEIQAITLRTVLLRLATSL